MKTFNWKKEIEILKEDQEHSVKVQNEMAELIEKQAQQLAALKSNQALTTRQYYKGQALVAILSCWKSPLREVNMEGILRSVAVYTDRLIEEDEEYKDGKRY
jgi:hypothetical protein